MVSLGHMELPMLNRRPFQLRLPDDLKKWLENQSAKNGSSQNSEVVRALRERMDRTEQLET